MRARATWDFDIRRCLSSLFRLREQPTTSGPRCAGKAKSHAFQFPHCRGCGWLLLLIHCCCGGTFAFNSLLFVEECLRELSV